MKKKIFLRTKTGMVLRTKTGMVLRMKAKIFLLLALASLPLQLPNAFAGRSESKKSPAQAQQSATPAAKWERYTYPGEEFSVELPGTPFFVEKVRAVRGARGLMEKTRVYELYGDGVAVLITSFDNPRRNESLENFADMSGLTTWRSRGVVAAVGDVASDGFKGREYNIAGDVYAGRARVLIAKRHAYVLESRSLDPTHPSLARFFDSLTLGEHPAGESAVELEYPGEFKTAPPAAVGLGRGPGRGGDFPLARPPDARPAPGMPHTAGEPYGPKEVTRRAV